MVVARTQKQKELKCELEGKLLSPPLFSFFCEEDDNGTIVMPL